MFDHLTLAELKELHEILLNLQEWWDNLTTVKGATIESCPRFGFELSTGTFCLPPEEYNIEELVWKVSRDLEYLLQCKA